MANVVSGNIKRTVEEQNKIMSLTIEICLAKAFNENMLKEVNKLAECLNLGADFKLKPYFSFHINETKFFTIQQNLISISKDKSKKNPDGFAQDVINATVSSDKNKFLELVGNPYTIDKNSSLIMRESDYNNECMFEFDEPAEPEPIKEPKDKIQNTNKTESILDKLEKENFSSIRKTEGYNNIYKGTIADQPSKDWKTTVKEIVRFHDIGGSQAAFLEELGNSPDSNYEHFFYNDNTDIFNEFKNSPDKIPDTSSSLADNSPKEPNNWRKKFLDKVCATKQTPQARNSS